MIPIRFIFILCLFAGQAGFGQEIPDSLAIDDGPYIFIEGDQLVERRIVAGLAQERNLPLATYPVQFEVELSEIPAVEKLIVLSDIHGQLDLFQSILLANNIVSSDLSWSFGDGHMVIVGDVFDRGPQVTETFWYLMKLDEQAQKVGGRVHMLLGNHEHMPLQNDLRYLHDKYPVASAILDTSYPELFSDQTVIGRWLRSKNTIVKIGRRIFVHGGISSEFLDRGLSLDESNELYRESLDMMKTDMKADSRYDHFHGSKCPIWYRGYFEDGLKKEAIEQILNRLDADEIIVGHTSQTKIVELYDGLIYGVDSSIKRGKYGEFLLIEGDAHYRLTLDGERLSFD